MEIPKNIKDTLKELGFTDYESQIYLTLITKGPLNAKDLSRYSRVPYSRIYQIIQALCDKKFIIRDDNSRPTVYNATPPMEALRTARKRYFDEIDRKTKYLFDELNPLFLLKSLPQRCDLFFIEGKDSCLIKMEKIINKARKSISIVTTFTEMLEAIYPVLEKMRLKGMYDIQLLIPNGRFENEFNQFLFYKKYLKIAEIRKTSNLFGNLVVIDDGLEFILFYEKKLLDKGSFSGFFSEEPLICHFILEMFNFLYKNAERVNVPKRKITKINIF
ncbi:MAG: TrmB family transcriptional regulator [Candidatus Helarchaeota archaeon]